MTQTSHKSSEELRYFLRNMGKSYLQFQEFMRAVKAGKSVAYLTPEGEVSSPKRTEQLLTAQKQAVVDEILGMLPKEIEDDEGWEIAFKQPKSEAEECCPGDDIAYGFNQAIAELRKLITELRP